MRWPSHCFAPPRPTEVPGSSLTLATLTVMIPGSVETPGLSEARSLPEAARHQAGRALRGQCPSPGTETASVGVLTPPPFGDDTSRVGTTVKPHVQPAPPPAVGSFISAFAANGVSSQYPLLSMGYNLSPSSLTLMPRGAWIWGELSVGPTPHHPLNMSSPSA